MLVRFGGIYMVSRAPMRNIPPDDFMYMRSEWNHSIQRLGHPINFARDNSLLITNIFLLSGLKIQMQIVIQILSDFAHFQLSLINEKIMQKKRRMAGFLGGMGCNLQLPAQFLPTPKFCRCFKYLFRS